MLGYVCQYTDHEFEDHIEDMSRLGTRNSYPFASNYEHDLAILMLGERAAGRCGHGKGERVYWASRLQYIEWV